MNQLGLKRMMKLKEPNIRSSYKKEDCVFVMQEITNEVQEIDATRKESLIDAGVHYSEMLPVEQTPSLIQKRMFYEFMQVNALTLAQHVADLSQLLWKEKGENIVLVSLARAGTPIGVLLKQAFSHYQNADVPHYSISIIRGKGIDENALLYILKRHPKANIQFVDGWTGKGAIYQELSNSINNFNQTYETTVSPELAVIADPAGVAKYRGTAEDIMLPSACFNSTVSGLVSRTIHREDIVKETDYHAGKFYSEFVKEDKSYNFIRGIQRYFIYLKPHTKKAFALQNNGIAEVQTIQNVFGVKNIHKVKPSVGETTRVILRRLPWKILVKDMDNVQVKSVLALAKEKGVPIEVYPHMSYACVGLIQEEGDE